MSPSEDPVDGAPSTPSALLRKVLDGGALTGKWARRAKAAGVTVMAAEASWGYWKRYVLQTRNRMAYTIGVSSEDEIYPELHAWLVSKIPARRLRSMTAAVQRDSRTNHKAKLTLFYDGRSEVNVKIEGQRVRVALEREAPDPFESLMRDNKPKKKVERIVFTAFGKDSRAAVVNMLQSLTTERNNEDRPPRFWIASQWGDWRLRSDLATRSIDTIALRKGQKEEIVDDLGNFLQEKADYERLGIPYHRGYLFHGPPGTGKTSIAKALASHFKCDIYFIAMSDLDKDTSLLQLVFSIEPGSVLLIEDVDVLYAATHRDDEQPFGGVTLSGLLNSLDGIGTPSGLVTFLTTNDLKSLDPALIRPGRIDRVENLDYVNDEQFAELIRIFVGEPLDLPSVEGKEITPADVSKVVMRNLRTREKIEPELHELAA